MAVLVSDLVPSVTNQMSGFVDVMAANSVVGETVGRTAVGCESVGDGAVVVPVAIDDDWRSVHSMRQVFSEANLVA